MPQTPLLIAHRGLWWPAPEFQNTLAALELAFASGFAIETDLRRDPGGRLVLSHDLLVPGQAPPGLADLFALMVRLPDAVAFLNVKEPGTADEASQMAWVAGVGNRTWMFDFELAGENPLTEDACPRLQRVSDRDGETPAGLHPWAAGFWVDQWDSDWLQRGDVDLLQTLGPAFVVSPELHGRQLDLGAVLRWSGAAGICTDMPHLVAPVLGGAEPLFPAGERWWEVD